MSEILIPRDYQIEASRIAIEQNSVINIRTNGGKTLIGILILNHFRIHSPDKKILFIVPTRVLVEQQSKYIEKHSNNCRVGKASGTDTDVWDRRKWDQLLNDHHVIVGTPDVFRKAFEESAYLRSSQFSLMIFDECHNATGNSPMASLLRHVNLQPPRDRPRLVGLTASFASGMVTEPKIIKKRMEIEHLMNGQLFAPEISSSEDLSNHTTKQYSQVLFSKEPDEILHCQKEAVTTFLSSIFETIFLDWRTAGVLLLDPAKLNQWIQKGVHVFVSLGAVALEFWLREGLFQQLLSEAHEVLHCGAFHYGNGRDYTGQARRVLQIIPMVQERVKQKFSETPSSFPSSLPLYSNQLLTLFKLIIDLHQHFQDQSSDSPAVSRFPVRFRGLIFVEQIALTYPLSYVIHEFFSRFPQLLSSTPSNASTHQPSSTFPPITVTSLKNLSMSSTSQHSFFLPTPSLTSDPIPQPLLVLPISGGGSMVDSLREHHLNLFRQAQLPLLVSTNALEEGIDVPDCSFIIRYDAFHSTKAHIQGSGRARCLNAQIYYFQNDPQVECDRADLLHSIASDKSISSTSSSRDVEWQRVKSVRETNLNSSISPPFPPSPTKFSQHEVLSNYISQFTFYYPFVASSSSVPSVITSAGEVNLTNCINIFTNYCQKVIRQPLPRAEGFLWVTESGRFWVVRFPTPFEWLHVSDTDVYQYWGERQLEDITSPSESLSGFTPKDKNLRKAVYLAVLVLHSLSLLDISNQPTIRATSQVCISPLPAPIKQVLPSTVHFSSQSLFSRSPISSSLPSPSSTSSSASESPSPFLSLPQVHLNTFPTKFRS